MNKWKRNLYAIINDNVKWLGKAKAVSMIFILTFFSRRALSFVLEMAVQYEVKVEGVFLPYLFSDAYYCMIFGILVIYFFSDAPFIKDDSFYELIRIGRVRWTARKIMSIISGSILLMSIVWGCSILAALKQVQFTGEWGTMWRTLSISRLSEGAEGLSYPRNIIVLFTPLTATLRVFLMGCLIVTMMGLIQFGLSLVMSRTTAMILNGVVALGPIIAHSSFKINIYFFSPLAWIEIVEHSQRYIYRGPDVPYMIAALSGVVIILIIAIMWKIRTVNLYENQEEEI